jgi:hypothetical protein
MRKATMFLFIGLFLLFMAGCGNQVNTAPVSNPATANVPVGLTVTDTPPAGVTVLFFQLSITGATLTSSTGTTVSLLPSTNPVPINVSQLLTDSAFLGNQNVPEGTYTLSLTFSPNTQLTIFNGSGATIGSGANACANNTVCLLTPSTTGSLTLPFTTAPFPITLTANSPLAFKVDIHLNTVIQSDSSGNPTVNLAATNGVTISELPTPPSGGPVPGLGHLTGTIQSLITNGFTLQTRDGRTFTVDVNSSTTYNYPSSVCSADNSTCLATQQVVKVEVSLQTGGTLLASEVNYVQQGGETIVEGNIIRLSTSGSNMLMDLILQKGPAAPSTLPMGHPVTVTVPLASGVVAYAIDSGSFTLPIPPTTYALSFASASDLIVGQEVSVVVQGSVTTASGSGSSSPWAGPAPITFTASSITLEPSQITGSVAAVNVPQLSFTLSTLPNFFVPPAATAGAPPIWVPVNITVLTTGATTFLPTTLTPDSISGLAINDVVSVEGWVFSTPTGPTTITLAAETVLDRGSATAPF